MGASQILPPDESGSEDVAALSTYAVRGAIAPKSDKIENWQQTKESMNKENKEKEDARQLAAAALAPKPIQDAVSAKLEIRKPQSERANDNDSKKRVDSSAVATRIPFDSGGEEMGSWSASAVDDSASPSSSAERVSQQKGASMKK